jgi:hypothetical protein
MQVNEKYLCPRCQAMLDGAEFQFDSDGTFQCATCGLRFVATEQYPPRDLGDFLYDRSCAFDAQRDRSQAERLARIAKEIADADYWLNSPLALLLHVLGAARDWIHFTSWGISHLIVGAMALKAAQGVQVRGVVSNVHPDLAKELDQLHREFVQYFDVRSVLRGESRGPHQKLVVIDGLYALKGSTNLTQHGWRKLEDGAEMMEGSADTASVRRLHNNYFSRQWLRHQTAWTWGDECVMEPTFGVRRPRVAPAKTSFIADIRGL